MRVRTILLLAVLVWTALAAPVPTPESHFGHKIGVDRAVLDWDKVVSYFQKLAASSDRIRFREIGKSTEGRSLVAAWISSAANIRTWTAISRSSSGWPTRGARPPPRRRSSSPKARR
jgi:hypothetical protein